MSLCKVLKNVKGKSIFSYDDCEFIRDLYKDFDMHEVQRNHNFMGKHKDREHRYNELIIRNY